jgi:hypothetical protein
MNIMKSRRTRQLLAATLAIGGTLQLALPVWADGTAAGTPITNTATGTFTDDTDPNTLYQTTSNEVKITIAEVAGINVVAGSPSNPNPNAGDQLYVEFEITNTGNDYTQFFIPGTATLSNTTAFALDGSLQITKVDGVDLPTPVTVQNAGATTGALGLANGGSVMPYPGTGDIGKITVRVPIRVLPSAPSGATLTVTLGNIDPNDPLRDRDKDIDANDLYTFDNPTAANGETNTTPPNNVQEGMATSSTITVNARLQAFAAVLKAVGNGNAAGYNNNNTPDVLSDDLLTYNLALKVDSSSPTAGLVAADLHGTQLNVDSSTANSYVLVSDAVPTGMQVSPTIDPVAPSGWQVVYSQTDLTTNALGAVWTTARPTSGGDIKRVGFIKSTPVLKGDTVSGFKITLTPTASFAGGEIANIAQVFGQSQPGASVSGTATQIVYDESGDRTTNNGLVGNDPTTVAIANGGITTGQADPAVDGVDSGKGTDPTDQITTNKGEDGPNSGTKVFGGEVTVFTIAATPLNGPNGQPGAVGPNNNNDDFTNKSIRITEKLAPDAVLTDAQTPDVIFTNTVQNTSGGTQAIAIRPTPPATPTALPDNTKVKITDPVTGNAVTYNYTAAGGFKYESGTPGTSESTPVKLSVPGGNGTANYTVTINLPGGMTQFQNYPVTITAFIDSDTNGQPTGEPSNQTINRVYTNYVRLDKKARILESNGTPVAGAAGSYTDNQIDLGAAATPGRVIEYQITYTNISSTQGTNGSNNVTLSAKNLVITENGSAGTNTWGAATFDPDYPTSAVGSAKDLGGGITVTTGGSPVDIQEYQDKIDTLLPGASGIFTFQRKIK